MQATETTPTVPITPVTQWSFGLIGMIFMGVILILVFIIFARYFSKMKNQPDDPFEPVKDGSTLSFLASKIRERLLLSFSVIIIILVPTIFVVGRTPVHRTDIEHTDPLGDVEDSNIDIIHIQSCLYRRYVVIKMTVAGRIVNQTASSSYRYILRIIVRDGTTGSSHPYGIEYDNGTLEHHYNSRAYVENSTLIIHFPISSIFSGDYMIGLEGWARSLYEWDRTKMEDNRSIERLWF